MTIPNEGLRVCTGCKKTQPEGQFYKRPSRLYRKGWYFIARCRTCRKAETATYAQRPENKAKNNVRARAKNARVKAAVFAAYDNKCACCGEIEMAFLTVDHVNNDGAKFRKEVLGNRCAAGKRTYEWLIKNRFPDGFQLLCMNCNWGKRMNQGICPHQATRNDHPVKGVPSSDGKRSGAHGEIQAQDMICSLPETQSRLVN